MLLREVASITQGLATSGKGAGARSGDWQLAVIESGDIEDDSLTTRGLRAIQIGRTTSTEKHLLRPFDVLVTARSQTVKVALVPPQITRTVVASTLLVVRPFQPEAGPWIWYYLSSRRGRAEIEGRLVIGATIPSLSADALGRVPVPAPSAQKLRLLADLVETSESAYAAGREAARLQRETLRDSIVAAVESGKSAVHAD